MPGCSPDPSSSAALERVAKLREHAEPWGIRATAALAWLVATLTYIRGVKAYASQDGGFADLAIGLILGSAAAYVGMAMTRRAGFAWSVCRQIAAATGTINALTLPAFLTAWVAAWLIAPESAVATADTRAIHLATAIVAAVTPWAIFLALGAERTKRWLGAM